MDPQIKISIKECEKIIPFFKVVSNTTRLGILCVLIEGERRVGDIQLNLGKKQSYVSQQLKYLRKAGYLKNRREGTQIYYRLVNDKAAEAIRYLKRVLR